MENWKNYNFESSSYSTPEFKQFSDDFAEYLIGTAPDNFKVLEIYTGHFYISGFVVNDNDAIGYFSLSDVRYWDWYNEVLYRTAKSVKDFTGGSNNYTKLPNLWNSFEDLLKK